MRQITHIVRAGYGYDFGCNNFGRAKEDTPVQAAPKEYAKPGFMIVYRVSDGERLHVTKQALREVPPCAQ